MNTDRIRRRAKAHHGKSNKHRWVVAFVAARIVGKYEEGETQLLARDLSLKVRMVGYYAQAGMYYSFLIKELRRLAIDCQPLRNARDSLGLKHFYILEPLELDPLDALSALVTASQDGISAEEMITHVNGGKGTDVTNEEWQTVNHAHLNGFSNTVTRGDFREFIEDVDPGEVSLVVTDPPYNIGFDKYDEYTDLMPDEKYIEMLRELCKFDKVVIIQYPEETMKFIVPALGVPDHVGAWCYNSNTSRRFRLISYYGCTPDYTRVTQDYKNPTDRRVKKLIAEGKRTPIYEWWEDIQIVKNVTKGNGAHPCPMPTKLMERIILLTTKPNEIVLDPFCGTGSTLVAAKQNGRGYIGFDVSEKYTVGALRRLRAVTPPMIAR